jgi:flagellar motor switch/type III secretory pathway protein FliN
VAIPSVEPFQWETLPAVARTELNARLAVEQSFDLTRLGASLHDLLQLDLEELEVAKSSRPHPPDTQFADCWLQLPDLSLLLRVEPTLAALAVSRIAGKSLPLDNSQGLSPGIHGAFTAIVHALGRRLARVEPPAADPLTNLSAEELDWHVDFTLRVNGARYRGTIAARAAATAEPPQRPRNSQLAACLPIRLEAVAAACRLSFDELAQLSVGDVLIPGDGWLTGVDAAGPYYLSTPGSETVLRVSASGQALQFDTALQLATEAPEEAEAGTLAATAVTARQLALIEVGSITLPAKRWLGLKPQDPLPKPQPGAHPAVLRVAGKRLAWGDLVTIEGQPGLSIRGLFDSSLGTSAARALRHAGV